MLELLVSVKTPHRQFGVLLWCGEVIFSCLGRWVIHIYRDILFFSQEQNYSIIYLINQDFKNFCGVVGLGFFCCLFRIPQLVFDTV